MNVGASGARKQRTQCVAMLGRSIIYMDYNATTPLRREALEAMMPFFAEQFANPSSAHTPGSYARAAIEEARAEVARALAVTNAEIVFTSGGTEGNHLALIGALLPRTPGTVVTTSIEHSSVLRPLQWLTRFGWNLRFVPLLGDGRVDVTALADTLDPSVTLVSVAWANNEVGTIQPMHEIARQCRAHGVLLHTDAVQAVGKISVDLSLVDLATVSAHKFGGPKGVGCVVVRKGTAVEPLLRGGAQERGFRAGTENVPGIVGMARAISLATSEIDEFARRTLTCRDRLWEQLARIPGVLRWGGTGEQTLPNTLLVTFDGVDADALIAALDLQGVCVSAGSACAAGSAEPSHVLLALGASHDRAKGAIRFSLGPGLSLAQVDFVGQLVQKAVDRLRKSTPQGREAASWHVSSLP